MDGTLCEMGAAKLDFCDVAAYRLDKTDTSMYLNFVYRHCPSISHGIRPFAFYLLPEKNTIP